MRYPDETPRPAAGGPPATRLRPRAFGRSPVPRSRSLGLGALLLALVLALLPLPQDPRAVAATDSESSAVTKRGGRGPYDDFSGLEVTVHQTRNLRGQGVQVTWKGGRPTVGGTDFLQIMQCWGDDPAGPRREQCQFGALSLSGLNVGTHVGRRVLVAGTDPREKEYAEDIPDPEFPGNTTSPFVPFTPVSGPATGKSTDWTYFSPVDTNEEPYLVTQPDGTGEAGFNVQSSREAPHLGCGDPQGTGAGPRGRGCWLVVVPRGSFDPDGTQNNLRPQSSPLSTTNWEQRLVFPLGFLPVGDPCPTDRTERRMTGSELVTEAVTSWQSALCAGGATRFTFSQRGEEAVRSGLLAPTANSPGLGFTVEPVEPPEPPEPSGGAPGGGAPAFVHAPVAVSGLTVGFFWEADDIGLVKDLRLSPRLLAKLLTLSYPYDVRVSTSDLPPPDHLKANPVSIVRDPEFLDLNPRFKEHPPAAMNYPGGILLSAERSDASKVVWDYLRGNREARAFLEGKPDPWGMKVNPHYADLGLPGTSLYEFPKADPTETVLSLSGKTIAYGALERSPYAGDLHEVARGTRRGSHNSKYEADLDTASGGLKLVGPAPLPGSRRAYGITESASAARYQLKVAALPDADGTYVLPTSDALLKAVGQFRDSAVPGVLAPDPARVRAGGYPLTVVTYAAASTGLPADARRDYARVMRYAAGPGQRQGTAPGDLPFGYAPLPAELSARAVAAADLLERGPVPRPTAPGTPSGTPGGPGPGADSGGGAGEPSTPVPAGAEPPAGASGSSGSGTGSSSGPGSGTGSAAAPPTPSGGTGTGAPSSAPPPAPSGPGERLAASATGTTPSQVLGRIRWILLGVLVAGAAAALAGPAVLRFAGRRPNPSDSPRKGFRHLKSD
ncbi:hypothetical protein ACWENA_06360 [Streptomyces sp. NPDC004779]